MFSLLKKMFYKQPPKTQDCREELPDVCVETSERDKSQNLGELSHTNHTYWKFCQSAKGRSIEKCFAEYEVGKITIAQDKEKLLSFVRDCDVAKCYMYGDVLVKLSFDNSDPLFGAIKDCPVKYIGGGLGEYETEKLLPERLYSLESIASIRKLFELTSSIGDLISIFCGANNNLSYYLKAYGFIETHALLEYLMPEFENSLNLEFKKVKENLLRMVDEYESHLMEAECRL